MKTALPYGLALAALLLGAGCSSSPSSRIARNRAQFDAYPAEVQAAIKEGRVKVGFTPEQATLALGAPDRVLKRTSEAGESEVWIYREKNSGFGVGLGVGLGSGPVGGGVGVSSGGGGFDDERLRVVFAAGRVAAIDQFNK